MTIKPKDVIVPFAVLFTLNVVLLACWTALAPRKWDRVPVGGVDMYGRPTESYGYCTSDNERLERFFSVPLLIVNLVAVVLACYQCYKAKTLPSEFNESRFLAISLFSLLETYIIGLPIAIFADDPTAIFMTRAVVLCMVCLAMLLPMFLPKLLNKRNLTPRRHLRSILSRKGTQTN